MDYKGIEEHLTETKEGSQSYKLDHGPLPRDVFKVKLVWRLMLRKWSYVSLFLNIIVNGSFINSCNDRDLVVGVLFLNTVAVLFIVSIQFFFSSTSEGWNDKSVRIWMVEILRVNPGEDLKKWDLIAAKMNTILYENDKSATRYFFYDGKQCLSRFSSNYVTSNSTEWYPTLAPFIKAAVDQYVEFFNQQFRQMTLGISADRTEATTQSEAV
ncbi:uncharacterized protein LALA0_S01e02300g [Lachancea lanzarotensis]|uniref:LALA0S01e02300g1_1 n=1 Tax=Lachancea lanzarotensis TaxID=1245769 RepID=A0A0C7MJZ5_9SACH|nr:uncharacterized protein LALA0_S01e02300g [Lachancea lanzarotensis]CEP60068.1 LALA0S01e02300g1_1 [Lachancea lanzarotensis]